MEKHKYLDKNVPGAYVFLLTDSNRQTFWVGMAEHIDQVKIACDTFKYQQLRLLQKQPRLVYYEAVESSFLLERYRQLQHYTLTQKARLIRTVNPNWSDLYPAMTASSPLSFDKPRVLPTRCKV